MKSLKKKVSSDAQKPPFYSLQHFLFLFLRYNSPFKLYDSVVVLYIHKIVQPSPISNYRIFSSPPKEVSYLLPFPPPPPAPGNQYYTVCLYGFVSSGYFIQMKSYNIWLLMFVSHVTCDFLCLSFNIIF